MFVVVFVNNCYLNSDIIVVARSRKMRMMSTANRKQVHFSHFITFPNISFPSSENCWMQLNNADEVTKKSSIHPMTGMSGIRSAGMKSYTIAPISSMMDVICFLFMSFVICYAKIVRWLWWLIISYVLCCHAYPVRYVLHE